MKLTNEFVPPMKPSNATEPPQKRKPSFLVVILSWIFTIMFFVSGLSAFPSIASVMFIAAAIVLFPLEIWQNKLRGKGIKGVLKVALFFVFLIAAGATLPKEENAAQTSGEPKSLESESVSENRQEETTPQESESQSVNYVNTAFDGDGYERVSAELLYEYGQYMEGRKVVTVIEAARDAYGSTLNAKTEGREDALTYSISCELNAKLPENAIHEGEAVTVAGTIAEKTPLISTTTLKKCSIIGMGEIAQEIKDAEDYQRTICEQYKKSHDDAIIAAEQNERSGYISECATVSYSDVERNPDNYKKTKIKVRGTVKQVIEGWFDSVTLRVEDANGDTWVITYIHKDGESRILEGDSITAYGECDGVTSVTNILGAQMTYPSMSMKYYD